MHSWAIELYDLSSDLGESRNVAAQHPEVVKRMAEYMKESHFPNKNWEPRGAVRKNQPVPGDGRSRF